jgi:hypothetical protein
MPFHGSADVGGKHRKASAVGTLDETLIAGSPAVFTEALRITGLSRVTAIVTQINGVPGNFILEYSSRTEVAAGHTTVTRFPPTVIGAIGVPQVLTVHLTAAKVWARVNGLGATFRVILLATGSS